MIIYTNLICSLQETSSCVAMTKRFVRVFWRYLQIQTQLLFYQFIECFLTNALSLLSSFLSDQGWLSLFRISYVHLPHDLPSFFLRGGCVDKVKLLCLLLVRFVQAEFLFSQIKAEERFFAKLRCCPQRNARIDDCLD